MPFAVRPQGVRLLLLLIAFVAMAGLRAATAAEPAGAGTAVKFPDYARPADVPYPKDNRYTPAKAQLGKALFFDPRLSGSGIMSCATCHNPARAWGDGLAKGVGAQPLPRRTPTILNLAWAPAYRWDGKAESLEAQARGPIQGASEMNLPLGELVKRLKSVRGYRVKFEAAFPHQGISPKTITQALATYERTVVSGASAFDKWNQGDAKAMSAAARRGFAVFTGKGQCAQCHGSWRFTDDGFHDIGLPDEDLGRGAVLSQVESMQHAFKTPTLRDVALRAPYMHNGSLATLRDVVEHYDRGGAVSRPSLSPDIHPLHLTPQEKKDLVRFLTALTSHEEVFIPRLPH